MADALIQILDVLHSAEQYLSVRVVGTGMDGEKNVLPQLRHALSLGYDMRAEVAKIADGDAATANGLMWALSRWFDEVGQRPLVNVHRRTLDDTWRQVIQYFGGAKALKLIPAPHDALVATYKAVESKESEHG